jgi:hypothetical protein
MARVHPLLLGALDLRMSEPKQRYASAFKWRREPVDLVEPVALGNHDVGKGVLADA